MPGSASQTWGAAALLMLTIISGCGGGETKPPEPPQRERAFATESDAAKRHQRGEFESALRQFSEAERLFTAIDDAAGIARNRRHVARSALHLGRPAEALARLAGLAENDIDTQLLRAQAQLGLGHTTEAAAALQAAAALCKTPCAQGVALQLLLARQALAKKLPEDAAQHARSALSLLTDQSNNDDGREAANAHRLLAEALLNAGQITAAEVAAQQALALDRKLALPEKIARDWLLLGHIRQKVDAEATAKGMLNPASRQAFQQARDIALAAGLNDILKAAEVGLASLAAHATSSP